MSAFRLPDRLADKADPSLIGDDERHFAAIGLALADQIADVDFRLTAERKAPGRHGQEVMDRDLEIHRLTARLRMLRRFGLDLCLGRIVPANGEPAVYIGRLGLVDRAGARLLVDWRSPAAAPFFAATHAAPQGLQSRRRYRWQLGLITDYWDEVFSPDGLEGHAALDGQSAFIASLGSTRSARMRDVLGTIQADQDAIIRAGSPGALVVDGGPGTGKTVVALHRSAYLLYSDPRLDQRRGGVLFVGPHQPYLAYVGDVLPSLGEDGVQTCTLRDLVPGGASLPPEPDPTVARLKSSAAMVGALEPAVSLYEEVPTQGMTVETAVSDVWLGPRDWAAAFAAPDPGTPHNEAREQIWDELVAILVAKHEDEDVSEELVRQALQHDEDLVDAFNRAWPALAPEDIVADLWSVPAYLRMCAPWLEAHEVRALQRREPRRWTLADLPLLDAARRRLGDPRTARREARREAAMAAQREEYAQVIDHLIESDDSDMLVMSMLRGDDLRGALVDAPTGPRSQVDRLAGPFAHIVVDEAQELTDAEWQMLLARCPSGSFTIVGDRAQARHGFTETWQERLQRVGVRDARLASLTINYRTPQEVMTVAEPVIREAIPDVNVPTSVRSTGVPVGYGSHAELGSLLDTWVADHAEGVGCVIGDDHFEATDRVQSLSPELAKGLEFDLVVLVDPDRFGQGIEGAVDRYVAMTRATHRLVVLSALSQGEPG
jgi:DNA helicase IV